MTQQLALFGSGISRARDLVGLGQSIGTLTHGAVDSSDLYRSGLTQSVSALDQYFHAVILERAAEIVLGHRPAGSGSRFGLQIGAIRDIRSAQTPLARRVVNGHLAVALSRETFQAPDDIAKGMAMVGLPALWSTAFGPDAGNRRQSLSLIVFRRNRIVHQCDADALTPGTVTPISDSDALGAVNTIEEIVRQIDSIL